MRALTGLLLIGAAVVVAPAAVRAAEPVCSVSGCVESRLDTRQRPTLKVRDYIRLPRTSRCARTVSAKPRAGAGVERVRLAIGKRVSEGKRPRLKLKARRSTVTVTVMLADGTAAIERLTYRRCVTPRR